MGELLALLAFFGGLAVIIGVPVSVTRWVMGPLDRAAQRSQNPTQFTIVDFLCLFFLIQLPMSINHWALFKEPEAAWGIDAYVWCVAGLGWWYGVRTLSRTGVRKPWRRIVFLVAVLPVTVVGSLSLAILTIVLIAGIFARDMPWAVYAWGAPIGIAMVAGIYGCGRFTRWLVAQAGPATLAARPPSGA